MQKQEYFLFLLSLEKSIDLLPKTKSLRSSLVAETGRNLYIPGMYKGDPVSVA